MFNNKWNGPNSLTAQGQGADMWNRAMYSAENLLPGADKYDLAALADAEADGAVKADLGATGADAIANPIVVEQATEMRDAGALEEPSEFGKRFGSVLMDMGKDMAASSAAPKIEAKPFRPKFTRQDVASYSQNAMKDFDSSGSLNLNPYGF